MREKDIYGVERLEDIEKKIAGEAELYNIKVDFFQSNHEGCIIDRIHEAKGKYDAIIINPGAFTHYSIAIRDAIKAVEIPAIEVHISNVYNREEFRSKSVIAPVCIGQISGLGSIGYLLALKAIDMLSKQDGTI